MTIFMASFVKFHPVNTIESRWFFSSGGNILRGAGMNPSGLDRTSLTGSVPAMRTEEPHSDCSRPFDEDIIKAPKSRLWLSANTCGDRY